MHFGFGVFSLVIIGLVGFGVVSVLARVFGGGRRSGSSDASTPVAHGMTLNCPHCGAETAANRPNCKHCGAEM